MEFVLCAPAHTKRCAGKGRLGIVRVGEKNGVGKEVRRLERKRSWWGPISDPFLRDGGANPTNDWSDAFSSSSSQRAGRGDQRPMDI
jgi:hypothetical protein